MTCETDAAGNILAAYTYGPDGGPATLRYQGQTYFYHTNDRGDVLGLTDASGAAVASYRYDAWGNVLEATGPVAVNPYRYAGYRQDDSTGLYHLKTRYYDAAIGRFLSQDALLGRAKDAGSLNRFVYAGNNPVAYVDSDGRDKLDVALGVAGMVLRCAALFVAAATPIGIFVAIATIVVGAASVVKTAIDYGQGKVSKTDLGVSIAANAFGVGGAVAGFFRAGATAAKVVGVLFGPYTAYATGTGYLDAVDGRPRGARGRR